MTRSVRDSFAGGHGVRRPAAGGRIHVDRPLPFLCVYRQPPRRLDRGTEELVTAQAAYLVASGAKGYCAELDETIAAFIDTSRATFGDALIVEIWAGPDVETAPDEPAMLAFRVHAADDGALDATLEELRNALGPLRIGRAVARVEQPRRAARHAPGLTRLAPEAACRWIGIEVAPVWRRQSDDAFFPLILQRLRRGLTRAIQRACYRFTRDHTPHRPRHYHALGRRAWIKAATDADAGLAAVNEGFDFLLLMTPTNADAAYERFRQSGYAEPPRFLYRHLPVDPALVKRRLHAVRIERVEDPTLADLFAHKRRELDLQLDALLARGSGHGRLRGRLLYGDVERPLLREAKQILAAIPAGAREAGGGGVNAHAFADAAQREFEHYRATDPAFAPVLQVRGDIAGLMVSRGRLLVPKTLRVPGARVDALLQHEIGTHIVTHRNGSLQPFRLLQHGLPGYDELQEGLAVLAEYLSGALSRPRLRLLAARVVAAHSLIGGARFRDTFRLLHKRWGLTPRTAFGVAMRVHRGGGLPKDAAYLRGLRLVVDRLGDGLPIEPLLVGKVSLQQVPVVHELLRRRVLREPALRPRFLDLPGARERLERLRPGQPLLELAQ
ncbi:MAG: flavohemoglobin expression-modulating QEGLA motif protein [Planctomycetota bacterium]|jgi:uncharacterized protein (TIGR02421 family)